MNRVTFLVVLLLGVFWADVRAGDAGEAQTARETWKAEWSSRFSDLKGEWLIELKQGDGVSTGTVKADGVSHELTAKREGSWLELSWKDKEGRITQVRAVSGAGEWRGVVFSGGGGRWVEYGRMSARPAR